MNNSNSLDEQVTHLTQSFSNDGEPTEFGCAESEIEDMLKISKRISNIPTCVVSHWVIWDFEACPSEDIPAFFTVKADHIIEDELRRFPKGGWVRTSPVANVYENCIFQTRNTSYILVGNGNRKQMTASDALRFI